MKIQVLPLICSLLLSGAFSPAAALPGGFFKTLKAGPLDGNHVPGVGGGSAVVVPVSLRPLGMPAGAPPDQTARYRPWIEKYAGQYGVDPNLVHAVMKRENPWGDPRRKSPYGAIGLMQLIPSTAKMLGVNPYDAEDNIKGGVKYLRLLLDKFDNDVVLAVAAYNAGDGAVDRLGRVPNYKETAEYVAHVFNHYYWMTGKRIEYEQHMAQKARDWSRKVRVYQIARSSAG